MALAIGAFVFGQEAQHCHLSKLIVSNIIRYYENFGVFYGIIDY